MLPRAISFTSFGTPSAVLAARSLPPLPTAAALAPTQATIRFLQAPVNPSDINVIQGVYPSKPIQRPGGYFVPGNEGLAEIHSLSPNNISSFTPGDWVIMRSPQLGTWASHALVDHSDILPLPSTVKDSLSTAHASTLAVNPPTALRMLSDFVQLKPGDYFVQNAANSAVGSAVIQIGHAKGYKSINFIRNRPNLQEVVNSLKRIGATHVFTYDELEDKDFLPKIKECTNNAIIRLGLNAVGGITTRRMISLLGADAHLISYGAMSKQPLLLPTSHLIFKNLTCHGYWQSRWYKSASQSQIQDQLHQLVDLMRKGKLLAPEHESVVLKGTDAEVTEQMISLMKHAEAAEHENRTGRKKVLLSWE